MKTIADELKQHHFFDGLDEENLNFIAACGKHEHFKTGARLAQEGDPADQFFILRKGVVTIDIHAPAGGVRTLVTLHEGDVVGWSWLFPPYRWQFDVVARGEVSVTSLDGRCLREKCENDTGLGFELMRRFARVMIDRLLAARLQLLDVYNKPGVNQ